MLPARLHLVALAASLAALLPAAAAAGALSDAEAALQRGDVGSALRLSFAATRDDTDNVAAHELYIDLMLGTNQAAAVLERYERLARERPGQPDFLYLLGRATPDPTASEAAFREALHHDPATPGPGPALQPCSVARARQRTPLSPTERRCPLTVTCPRPGPGSGPSP